MARIRVKSADRRLSVTVRGPLRARDLRRLERACGPALEHQRPPLTIRLSAAEAVDGPARTYLERLIERGVLVVIEGIT